MDELEKAKPYYGNEFKILKKLFWRRGERGEGGGEEHQNFMEHFLF
jgi:hypothetical protein